MEKEQKLGDYLYLAMGFCNGHKVVMGVGYTPEYALKKAIEFQNISKGLVVFEDISKIKNGEKIKCETITF